MAKKTRILIADDHAIFRHGLRDIIERHFPGVTVGETNTGQGAIEQVRRASWSLVVLDVSMPGRSGVDALVEIRQIQPAARILMLSMHPEEQYALRALRAGAAGYITKIRAPLDLVEAVKKVLSGGRYVSPALAEQLLARGAEGPPHERLSRREHQVMCLIPSGKSLKAIAGELGISSQTVSTHRARILKKMGLRTTAGLIRYAMEYGLAD